VDDGLKQRIVGAIVLAAAAIIFLPMLADDNVDSSVSAETQIPEPPKAPAISDVDPDKVANNMPPIETAAQQQGKTWQEQDQAPNAFDEDEPAPQEPVQSDTEKPIPDGVKIGKNGLPESWTLQVGAFSDKSKAQTLSDTLAKKGYQSYVRAIKDDKGASTFKVFVGPDVQRAHLEDTMKKLLAIKQELHIGGILLKPYEP
jgi:DedD protein